MGYGTVNTGYPLKAGKPGGVATLGSDGKIPESQLPEMDFISTSQKGIPEGVASLDSDGKIPNAQMPDFVTQGIPEMKSQIATLWDALFTNITGNPFTLVFSSLEGFSVTAGVYNEAQSRLEC